MPQVFLERDCEMEKKEWNGIHLSLESQQGSKNKVFVIKMDRGENRFNPDMSMDYLKVIGQLISQSLKSYQLKSI